MRKPIAAVFLCLSTVIAFAQQRSNYQIATIVTVTPHNSASSTSNDAASYDVSLRVNGEVYVVLYKPPVNVGTVQYSAGREVLVMVGPKTITYHDLLGQAYEAPIVSRHPADMAAQPKAQ